MRFFICYIDTRTNEEDFAITPYLFLVKHFGNFQIVGLGICWGYWSIAFQIGLNVPKEVPFIFNPETIIKNHKTIK